MKKILYLSIVTILFLSACKKEDTTPASEYDVNKYGYIAIKFDNQVGNLNLVLDSPFYTNPLNQKYTISKFNYYVSNIVFINEDGTERAIPQDSSYFLIEETNPDSKVLELRVPEGNYKSVKFIIGVDSLRSTRPVNERTGVLDPAGAGAGMYWTWNSGYIFMKMEGTYDAPNDTFATSQPYLYHIGGFGPTINNIKTAVVDFNTSRATVRNSRGADAPEVHIYVDASKVISGNTNVDFTLNNTVMFAPYSITIANNYVNMFSLAHIHDE